MPPSDSRVRMPRWSNAPPALVLVSCASLFATAAAAQSQPVLRTPLGLDVSLPAAKRLAGAREFVAAKDWDAAISAVEQVTREFGTSLVEVAPGQFLNVEHVAAAFLAALPADGLAEYRRRVDPAMQPLFDEARLRRDRELMQQVVHQGLASSVGDEALDWLAEEAMARGELDLARTWWTALLPIPPGTGHPALRRYPDADLPPAEVTARLVLCSILQQDHARTRREREIYRTRHADAEGYLAGRSGKLADILDELADAARHWRAPDDAGWRTLGGDVSRGHVAARAPEIGRIQWMQPLPPAGLPLVERSRPALPSPGPPACFPAVTNDTVLVSDAGSVRAWDLATGAPRWPDGSEDGAAIYSDSTAAVEPAFPTAGVPRFSGHVHNNRYYTRLGLPVIVPAARELSQSSERLVCLDLAAEGRLEWSVGSDILETMAGGRFSGPPLIVDDRLYAAVRRPAPQVEIGIVCLQCETGEKIWERAICAAIQQPPAAYHLVGHDVLTFGEGMVFHAPGAGVIAALDAVTGQMRWVSAYPSAEPTLAALSDPGQSGVSAPVYDGGRLFVKPNDSGRIMALDAATGSLIWEFEPTGRVLELLGVESGRLIAAGDQLWGLRVEDAQAWRFGFDDPEGYGFGRGAIAAGRVYWTTRDELFVVETETGRLVDRVPLQAWAGLSGGNVIIADGRLLIAGPRQLTVFGP